MAGVWLEVALNRPWGQKSQPLMPVRIKDIIDDGKACVKKVPQSTMSTLIMKTVAFKMMIRKYMRELSKA